MILRTWNVRNAKGEHDSSFSFRERRLAYDRAAQIGGFVAAGRTERPDPPDAPRVTVLANGARLVGHKVYRPVREERPVPPGTLIDSMETCPKCGRFLHLPAVLRCRMCR